MPREPLCDKPMVGLNGTVRPDQRAWVMRHWRERGLTGWSELFREILDEYIERVQEEGEE